MQQSEERAISKLKGWGVRLRSIVAGTESGDPTIAVYADIPYEIRGHHGTVSQWLMKWAVHPRDAKAAPPTIEFEDLPRSTLLRLLVEAAAWRSDAQRVNRVLESISKLPDDEKRFARLKAIFEDTGLTLDEVNREAQIGAEGERWETVHFQASTPNDAFEIWLECDETCDAAEDDMPCGIYVDTPDKRLYEGQLFPESRPSSSP